MSYDIKSIFKNVLKKIYICIAISVVVALGCFIINLNNNGVSTYTAQVFIDQDFPEKHPVVGVTYLDSVESKTKVLINNSIVALKSKTYLLEVCTSCDVTIKDVGELENLIRIEKESDNIISIEISYKNAEMAEKICKKIVETMPIRLNAVIQKNIDEITGQFKEGTLENDKIIAYSINQFASSSEPHRIKITLISGFLTLIVSVGVIFLIEIFKDKAESVDYLKKCFNVPIDSVNTLTKGILKMLAEKESKQKIVAVYAKNIDMKIFESLEQENIGKRIRTFYINGEDNNIVDVKNRIFSEDYALLNSAEISNLIKEESQKNDCVLVVVNNCYKNSALEMFLNMSDKSILFVKNREDSIRNIQALVTRINDKNCLLSNICLYNK